MRKLGLSLLVLAMACGGGGGGGSSQSGFPSASEISNQAFTGALGDGSVLTVQVGAAAAAMLVDATAAATTTLSATGSVLPIGGGSSVPLTGSYDPATGALSLSGAGFTLTGTYDATTGSIVGDSGTFVVAIGSAADVKVYCGNWAFTDNSDSGAFTLMISGSHAWGVTSSGIAFSGSVGGTTISMTVTGHRGTISGNVGSGGAVSGTFASGDGSGGTWSGSSSSCPTGT